MTPLVRARPPLWHSSFYWRIALSFIALVLVVLAGQSVMLSYLMARGNGPFAPDNPNAAAAAVAAAVGTALARDASADPAPILSGVRALAARDTSCRFPGCTSRRCDAHHVHHWADGGATRIDNLLLRCRRHHRGVHEGGFRVTGQPDGTATFVRPDGMPLEAAPSPPLGPFEWQHGRPLTTETPPTWDGTPLNIAWAIDVLRPRSNGSMGAC